MFEKSDQRFLQALGSQEELGRLLERLRMDRKVRAVFAACSFLGAMVLLIISSRIAQGMGPEMSTYVMLPSVMILFFPLILFIQTCHTNSQIRSLLVFQRLTDLKKPAVPRLP